MSSPLARSLAVRSLAALAGIACVGVLPRPAVAQDAPESRDARGSIRKMERLSPTEGWALTDKALLFTRDGGLSWADMAPGERLDGVTDAFFLGASHAWLAGVDPGSGDRLRVLQTTNGGAKWRLRRVEASALLGERAYARAEVRFLDAAHGWLLGQLSTSAAFSVAELLRTSDGGATWERLPQPPVAGRFVFVDATRGFMTGAPVSTRLYGTRNGGRSWRELRLPVSAAPGMALYDLPVFRSRRHGTLAVTLRGDSPRLLTFVTRDGGRTWSPATSLALPAGGYGEPVPVALSARGQALARADRGSLTLLAGDAKRALPLAREDGARAAPAGAGAVSVRALSLGKEGSGWALLASGGCEAGVCRQVTRLVAVDGSSGGAVEDLLVRTEEEVQLPPEPELSTSGAVISFDKGFDKCEAPTVDDMQVWKDFSPYKDANIYYGGDSRYCKEQFNLNPSWVAAVFAQGWRLIPTWVGPQAPCSGLSTLFSEDAEAARAQGLAEADAAVAAAAALGLGAGTPLYYDLELYEIEACEASEAAREALHEAVREFVSAWSERVGERGYLAGVYGNPRNAQADWRPGVIDNPPEAVWLASPVCGKGATSCSWSPTVFGIPGLDDASWASDQRIRQYWSQHGETIGGVPFTIDSDYANGPVAAASSSCQPTVPADHWKGEYFRGVDPGGTAVMVRDDGTGPLDFDWGAGSPGGACGVPADEFSVRWTRTAYFDAGYYEFDVTSDDGFRLYVDGVQRMQAWKEQGPTRYTENVTLAAGHHTVRMEYYEQGGGAVARLSWKLLSNCFTSVPSTSWKGEYFDNQLLSGSPAMVRNDGTGFLDFLWYSDSPSPECGFPADDFSVRWTRSVHFAAGTYRFTITSDDGFRLYVDGVLKHHAWFPQGPTDYRVDVPLSAGNHTIVLEYYEKGGWAVARLSWKLVSASCSESVPSTSWKGEYFTNQLLSGSPAMVRNDGTGFLDFLWYSGSPSPECGFPADDFSVRWTRSVSFSAGTYRFDITSDDGFRLYVDGVLRMHAWKEQGPTDYSVDLPLSAGDHTIRLEYYEKGGWAVARLSWKLVSSPSPSVVVVDDLSSGFSRFGPTQYWWQAPIGYQDHMFWTYVNGTTTSNYARWTPNLSSGGAANYKVYIFVPRDNATSQQARYRIRHNGADVTFTVNQSVYFDQWVFLGRFDFAATGGEYVELVDATGEAGSTYRKLGFDAVKFER